MRIDFFFDPGCPWCWLTSRWIEEVSPHRDLDVHWRSFSLILKNADHLTDRYRELMSPAHGMLRVVEAVRRRSGEAAVGALYTELGAQIHHDKVASADVDIAGVLDALGLPDGLAGAADDKSWDSVIRESMDEGLRLTGGLEAEVGTPIVAFDGKQGYFGPVMTPAPHGEAALQLFDSLAAMVTIDGFYELKRGRERGPELADRPRAPEAAQAR
ncbi:MAG: disulfide bond formation protein DsbA [Candidatus Dormibacteria bacterium]